MKNYELFYVLLLEVGLVLIVIFLNSMINMFVVLWNNFIIYYEVVFGYEVVWRYLGSLLILLGLFEKKVN